MSAPGLRRFIDPGLITASRDCQASGACFAAGCEVSGMDRNTHNTQGVPGEDEDADTASGGAPEMPDTTDENGAPVDNPSGG